MAVLVVLSGPLVVAPGHGLSGQEAVVRVPENLRAEPNGTILGRLEPGTRLRVEARQGSWTRVHLEGYVWTRSLQSREEGDFDLIVSVEGGENFREEPGGRIAVRLVQGTRLEEVERVPGWVRVRRSAWVWAPSLDFEEGAGTSPSPATDAAPATGPSGASDRWVRPADGEAAILSAPDGDTLGRARAGADLRILAREGNWARVQLDGWIWLPVQEGDEGDAGRVLEGVSVGEITSDPARFRGRVVAVELQFVSLERAERVRTDFYEGEPFLLTRSVGAERTFVYVAVPPEFVEEAEGYTALERLRVVGRVRTGAAELTGNPILELLEVERIRR